jgi:hypothetical protein
MGREGDFKAALGASLASQSQMSLFYSLELTFLFLREAADLQDF